jgi:hypothetical protein
LAGLPNDCRHPGIIGGSHVDHKSGVQDSHGAFDGGLQSPDEDDNVDHGDEMEDEVETIPCLPSYVSQHLPRARNDAVERTEENGGPLRSTMLGQASDTRHTSRAATPWNPQNLMVNVEKRGDSPRPQISRRLQRILGEFPIDNSRSHHQHTDAQGLQDPLWLITGLSQRGWKIRGEHEAAQGPLNHDAATSSHAALPASDLHLLGQWTPQTFMEIERDQAQYIMHGMHGSKCDVAHALDPVHHGLLTEERARELVQVQVHHPI